MRHSHHCSLIHVIQILSSRILTLPHWLQKRKAATLQANARTVLLMHTVSGRESCVSVVTLKVTVVKHTYEFRQMDYPTIATTLLIMALLRTLLTSLFYLTLKQMSTMKQADLKSWKLRLRTNCKSRPINAIRDGLETILSQPGHFPSSAILQM